METFFKKSYWPQACNTIYRNNFFTYQRLILLYYFHQKISIEKTAIKKKNRRLHWRCSIKENLRPATIKKETLVQVFSCKLCEIFKNTFFTEHLWTTASLLFQNPFSWLLVYHFITLLETWIFIQCSIDVHIWTVVQQRLGFFKTHHLLCYYISFYFTKKIFNCGSYLTSFMAFLRFFWSLVKFPWW